MLQIVGLLDIHSASILTKKRIKAKMLFYGGFSSCVGVGRKVFVVRFDEVNPFF